MEETIVIDEDDHQQHDNFGLEVMNVDNTVEPFQALEFPSEQEFQLDTAEEYISEQGFVAKAQKKSNKKSEDKKLCKVTVVIDDVDDKNDENLKVIYYDEKLFKFLDIGPLDQFPVLRVISQQFENVSSEQNVCEKNKDLILPCENLAIEESNAINNSIDSSIDEINGNPNTDNSMEMNIHEQIESQSINFNSFDMKLYDYDAENTFDTNKNVDPYDETMAILINDVNFGIPENIMLTNSQGMATSENDVNFDNLRSFDLPTDNQDMAIPINDVNFGIPENIFLINSQGMATSENDVNFDNLRSFDFSTNNQDMAIPINDVTMTTPENEFFSYPTDSQDIVTSVSDVNFDTPKSVDFSTDSEEMATLATVVNIDSSDCFTYPTGSQDMVTPVNDVNSQDFSQNVQPGNEFIASTNVSDWQRTIFAAMSAVNVNNDEPEIVQGFFHIRSNDGDYLMFYKPSKNTPSVVRFVSQEEESQQHTEKPPDPVTGQNDGASMDQNHGIYPEPISQTNPENSQGVDPNDLSPHSMTNTEPNLPNVLKDTADESIIIDLTVENTVEVSTEPGPSKNAERRTRTGKQYICKFCGHKSNSERALEIHVQTCTKKRKRVYRCEKCSRKKKRMNQMMDLLENTEMVYGCVKCNFMTAMYDDLKPHKLQGH